MKKHNWSNRTTSIKQPDNIISRRSFLMNSCLQVISGETNLALIKSHQIKLILILMANHYKTWKKLMNLIPQMCLKIKLPKSSSMDSERLDPSQSISWTTRIRHCFTREAMTMMMMKNRKIKVSVMKMRRTTLIVKRWKMMAWDSFQNSTTLMMNSYWTAN